MTNLTYWAAETDQRKLINRIMDRWSWHIGSLRATGRLEKIRALFSAYYGRGTDGQRDSSRQLSNGEQGEVTEMHVNAVKPIVQNTLSIICGTRPGVKPVATNGDAATSAQTRLALGLHEFYDRKMSAKSLEIETVRGGLITSAMSLCQEWKTTDGAEIGVDENNHVLFEGDIGLFCVPPWRIAYEPGASNEAERRWTLFKRKANRHDLIANCKDEYAKQKLAQMDSASAIRDTIPLSSLSDGYFNGLNALFGEVINPEDEVWLWELRHMPTPSLPLGRLVKFVEPDIILFDSMAVQTPEGQKAASYPYEELHAYEYCPERVIGTTFGHSNSFDILALQEMLDQVTATIATTVNVLGMPMIWSRAGSGPNMTTLDSGVKLMETMEKPEQITFEALSPEMVKASDWIFSLMRQSAALNDTVMGSPPAGMPASAQALQRAQAVSYHQVAQDEWVRLVEKNANGRLRLLKRFARTKRIAEIAGAAGAYEVKEWQREDIAGVERFQVEPINPMSTTFEGRQMIADSMQLPPDQMFDFMTTGNLNDVTNAQKQQVELVEANTAKLLSGVGLAPVDMEQSQLAGEPIFVDDGQEHLKILKSDPHHIAIMSYLSVANNPAARMDGQLTQNAIDAVMESFRLWGQLTPDECFAFQIPMMPSHQMAPPTAEMPVMTPEENSSGAVDGQPAENIDLPKPPKDPLTGAEAPPLTGLQ